MREIGRRGFLGLMGTAAAAALATTIDDPERLIWVPGRKTIFLPPEKKIVPGVDAAVEEIRRVLRGLDYGRGGSWSRYVVSVPGPRGVESFAFDSNWRPTGSKEQQERAMKAVFLGGMAWKPALPQPLPDQLRGRKPNEGWDVR